MMHLEYRILGLTIDNDRIADIDMYFHASVDRMLPNCSNKQ